jgi:uncharacterized RDD family membrane protein YckC
VNNAQQISFEPCGLLRRLAAIVYDAAVVTALLMLAAALALLAGLRDQAALRDAGYTFYLFAVWAAYIVGCWHIGGMTLGMRAWRVRVLDERNRPPGWGRSLLRFLASLLSAAALGLGFFWCLADPQQRSWHDMLSRTRLVKQPRA